MNQGKIIIIAGPNGAGKTSFAREFLPKEAACLNFINADLIAAGLSPFEPEKAAIKAGRMMLTEIAQHLARRSSFALETTLSGRSYAEQIPVWRSLGFRVELYFLSLPTAEIAVQRVAERVAQGGHNIPEATIRRRFIAGRRLSESLYRDRVDQWVLYDNSGVLPVVLDHGSFGDKAMKNIAVEEPEAKYQAQPCPTDIAIAGSLQALKRAALKAAELARQTGTCLIVVRDGEVVRMRPEPADAAAELS